MNRRILPIALVSLQLALSLVFAAACSAYWVWTPETKKFINPKYAVKDSPKEQLDWAMAFYDSKDYERAAFEFEKLAKQYEFSEYAPKAQYYVGLCYENMGKYYLAFQNYQKAIDNFPHIDNIEEIIARQSSIGDMYASKENPKVLGTDIMTSYDRAIEIYQKVVDNAPFGKLADQAQFKLGEAMKGAGRFDEATVAFQKLVEDYPQSALLEKARYEVANCAYKASLRPAYDAAPTEKAIKAFEEFTQDNKDTQLTKEADETIKRLKDKAAEKSMMTAEFYDKIGKRKSASVYYKDVLDRFPESSYAPLARAKIEEINRAPSAEEKKGWLPWPSPGKKKGREEAVQGQQGQAVEGAVPEAKQKSKGWFPMAFGKKAEAPAEEQVAEEKPARAKSGWFSLGLGSKAKPPARRRSRRKTDGWFWRPFGKKSEEPNKEIQPSVPVKEEEPVSAAADQAAPAAEEKKEEPAIQPEAKTADEAKDEAQASSQAADKAPEPAQTAAADFTQEAPPSAPTTPFNPAPVIANTKPPEPKPLKLYFEEVGTSKTSGEDTSSVKPEEGVVKEPAQGWVPFKFDKRPSEKKYMPVPKTAKQPVSEKAEEKTGWKPFSFEKKNEEPAEKTKKEWVPFRFDDKKKSAEVTNGDVKTAAKKGWVPLNFERKE